MVIPRVPQTPNRGTTGQNPSTPSTPSTVTTEGVNVTSPVTPGSLGSPPNVATPVQPSPQQGAIMTPQAQHPAIDNPIQTPAQTPVQNRNAPPPLPRAQQRNQSQGTPQPSQVTPAGLQSPPSRGPGAARLYRSLGFRRGERTPSRQLDFGEGDQSINPSNPTGGAMSQPAAQQPPSGRRSRPDWNAERTPESTPTRPPARRPRFTPPSP